MNAFIRVGEHKPPVRVTIRSVNPAEREWIEHDDALRRRARELARTTGRDEDDLYRTLRHLERTPSERLELGLRHARLRVHGK